MCNSGMGFPASFRRASAFYKRAIELGDERSKENMILMRENISAVGVVLC